MFKFNEVNESVAYYYLFEILARTTVSARCESMCPNRPESNKLLKEGAGEPQTMVPDTLFSIIPVITVQINLMATSPDDWTCYHASDNSRKKLKFLKEVTNSQQT